MPEKLRNRTATPCVSYEANDAFITYLELNTLRLGEYRFAPDNVEKSRACAPREDQKPCLPARIQAPDTVRLQLEALEYEVRIGGEQCSPIVEASRQDLSAGRCSLRHSESVINMKLPMAAVVEKAKCGVASLLNLRDHQSRTDGVDRAGRHEYSVASRDRAPGNEVSYGAIVDGQAQLPRRQGMLQTEGNGCAKLSTKYVPRFRLAVRQTDRLREGVAGMHLNRQRLAGQQDLKQQRGFGRSGA